MSEEEREKKNKKIALMYTTGIQVVLFVLLFFIVAWRAPDPPLPEYGIELNFGMDEEGSGNVQPETPVGNDGKKEEPIKESKPEVKEKVEPVEEKIIEEVKPVEPKVVEEQIVSKIESPVVVKEKKEEVKPAEKPEEKKVEPKVVEKKVEEKPKINPDAVYKPSTQPSTSDAKSTSDKAGKPGNQGDDPGKTGDKGSPEGKLDADALYGKSGGGDGGSSLALSGWTWNEKPSPNVPNNESGRLVFEIKVDSNGDIVSIRTLERSVSSEAEQVCRRAVEKLTFNKTGANVPEISTGKITFLVRAK